jgi:hypothetical protein
MTTPSVTEIPTPAAPVERDDFAAQGPRRPPASLPAAERRA